MVQFNGKILTLTNSILLIVINFGRLVMMNDL